MKAKQSEYWSEIRSFMHDDATDTTATAPDVSEATPKRSTSKKKTGGGDWKALHQHSWDSNFSAPVYDVSSDLPQDAKTNDDDRCCSSRSRQVTGGADARSVSTPVAAAAAAAASRHVETSEPSSRVHEESEALFKSMLRMGIDDGPGFVFDSSSVDDDSADARRDAVDKTQHQINDAAAKRSVPFKARKLMKGVPQSKLLLKPLSVSRTRTRSTTPHEDDVRNDNL